MNDTLRFVVIGAVALLLPVILLTDWLKDLRKALAPVINLLLGAVVVAMVAQGMYQKLGEEGLWLLLIYGVLPVVGLVVLAGLLYGAVYLLSAAWHSGARSPESLRTQSAEPHRKP